MPKKYCAEVKKIFSKTRTCKQISCVQFCLSTNAPASNKKKLFLRIFLKKSIALSSNPQRLKAYSIPTDSVLILKF